MEDLKRLENNLNVMYEGLDSWYITLDAMDVRAEGYIEVQTRVLTLQQKVLDAQQALLAVQKAILNELKK